MSSPTAESPRETDKTISAQLRESVSIGWMLSPPTTTTFSKMDLNTRQAQQQDFYGNNTTSSVKREAMEIASRLSNELQLRLSLASEFSFSDSGSDVFSSYNSFESASTYSSCTTQNWDSPNLTPEQIWDSWPIDYESLWSDVPVQHHVQYKSHSSPTIRPVLQLPYRTDFNEDITTQREDGVLYMTQAKPRRVPAATPPPRPSPAPALFSSFSSKPQSKVPMQTNQNHFAPHNTPIPMHRYQNLRAKVPRSPPTPPTSSTSSLTQPSHNTSNDVATPARSRAQTLPSSSQISLESLHAANQTRPPLPPSIQTYPLTTISSYLHAPATPSPLQNQVLHYQYHHSAPSSPHHLSQDTHPDAFKSVFEWDTDSDSEEEGGLWGLGVLGCRLGGRGRGSNNGSGHRSKGSLGKKFKGFLKGRKKSVDETTTD